MTNIPELIHRYRLTAAYLVYVVYVAFVFQVAGAVR